MQRRPQARIGKALVVAEIMLRRHVDGGQRAGAERLDPGERILGLRGIADMAAGADPDGAGLLDHRIRAAASPPAIGSSGCARATRLETTTTFTATPPVSAISTTGLGALSSINGAMQRKSCDSKREPFTAVLWNFCVSRSRTLGRLYCSAVGAVPQASA